MYSSVKFLSPIVTPGLPAPALELPTVADVLAVDSELPAFVLEDWDELPHAASRLAKATAAIEPWMCFQRLFLIVPPVGVYCGGASVRLGDERRERHGRVRR